MKPALAVDKPGNREAAQESAPERIERAGESLVWCGTCEHYLPRHICEWKVLLAIVLGAGVASIIGVLVIRSL
jgi:hypothetical protein